MSAFTVIDHSYEDAPQPKAITLAMKSHQSKMYKHCLKLERNEITFKSTQGDTVHVHSNIGVIGNSVGSGKSLIMMALMATPIFDTERRVYFESSMLVQAFKCDTYRPANNINVLLVPHGIFLQWLTYLNDQTTLSYESVVCKSDVAKLEYDKQVIIVCSSNWFDFASAANEKNLSFGRLFIDEVDSITTPNCAKINTHFTWFVSSSVNNLRFPKGATLTDDTVVRGLKHRGYIKDTFVALQQSQFRKYIFLKTSAKLVRESFNLPDPEYIPYLCKGGKMLDILRGLIPETVQMMICGGDMKGAIAASNVEKSTETNLIGIVCNQLFLDIENRKVDLSAIRQKTYRDPDRKVAAIEKCESDIAEMETKIDNLRVKIRDSNIDPITYDEITHPTVIKCCKEVFDFESITVYITTKPSPLCPMCRTPITKNSLVVITKDVPVDTVEEKPSVQFIVEEHGKVEVLDHIMSNVIAPNAKVLIFSSFDETFTTIERVFSDLDIEWRPLKGAKSTINVNLKWHSTDGDKPKVLFLNAKYMGAGINMHWATDVIIYHRMDPELETQIIGRSNRPPRTTSTKVHRLLYKGTEDE